MAFFPHSARGSTSYAIDATMYLGAEAVLGADWEGHPLESSSRPDFLLEANYATDPAS